MLLIYRSNRKQENDEDGAKDDGYVRRQKVEVWDVIC